MGRGHLRVSGYIFSQTAALHNLFLERSQKQQGYSRASFHTFKFKGLGFRVFGNSTPQWHIAALPAAVQSQNYGYFRRESWGSPRDYEVGLYRGILAEFLERLHKP